MATNANAKAPTANQRRRATGRDGKGPACVTSSFIAASEALDDEPPVTASARPSEPPSAGGPADEDDAPGSGRDCWIIVRDRARELAKALVTRFPSKRVWAGIEPVATTAKSDWNSEALA